MARDALKAKLMKIFRKHFPGRDDKIIVRKGFADFLHLYVVSKQFKGKRFKAGEETIWPILSRELTEEEWGRVSLIVGVAPDEIDGFVPELQYYLDEKSGRD
jgi:hypothetical protein